jgi:hypothetical protein
MDGTQMKKVKKTTIIEIDAQKEIFKVYGLTLFPHTPAQMKAKIVYGLSNNRKLLTEKDLISYIKIYVEHKK